MIAKQLAEQGGRLLATADDIERYLARPEAALLLMDDFDEYITQEGASALMFHLLNAAQNAAARLVIFAKQAPTQMDIAIPDLHSRMGTFEVLEIGAPDDTLILQLLAQGFSERGVFVKADVLTFLAARLGRDYADIQDAIAELDHAARRDKSKINKALVRAYLEERAQEEQEVEE